MAKVKTDITNLKKLIKGLKTDCKLRVGILGSDAKHKHADSSLTNAELGSVHEFGADINHPGGTPYKIVGNGRARFVPKSEGQGLPVTKPHGIHIPRRSFLEDPLKQGFNFNKDEMKPVKKSIWKSVFVKNKPEEFLNMLGGKALDIIRTSWDAGGKPEWTSLTAATKRQKAKKGGSPNILTDTGQLMGSISFKVIKKQ